MTSAALIVSFFLLGLIILVRAAAGEYLSRFPLFYSYVVYMLLSGAAVTAFYFWSPGHYPSVYWFRILLSVFVEFAVLVEISDHIFNPYPAIGVLGRFLTLLLCAAFFFLYILPALIQAQPSSLIVLDLGKRTSLTKAVIIVVLLGTARRFRLPLGTNVSGIMLGFSVYLATNVANFALAEEYGRELYERTFSILLPLSYTLGMLVWTIALWSYEPVVRTTRASWDGAERSSEPLSCQLGRFNTTLMKLLRK